MINYAEYFNLYGLSFSIGFDREDDTEWDNDFRIVLAVDYAGIPIVYDYWGNCMSFIGEL